MNIKFPLFLSSEVNRIFFSLGKRIVYEPKKRDTAQYKKTIYKPKGPKRAYIYLQKFSYADVECYYYMDAMYFLTYVIRNPKNKIK